MRLSTGSRDKAKSNKRSSSQADAKLAREDMRLVVIQELVRKTVDIRKGDSSCEVVKRFMQKCHLNSNDKFLLKQLVEQEIINVNKKL